MSSSSPDYARRVQDGKDAVVVVAQEALAAAALGWQVRAERLAEANARLRSHVAEVEEAHRKSLTVVKSVPALPNNHVFTKQLVDENHALRCETRALQRQLMQFKGSGSKQLRSMPQQLSKRKGPRVAKSTPNPSEEEEAMVQQGEKPVDNLRQADNPPTSTNIVELARHPLVQKLKTHLRDLEIGLDRLRQENEMLRTELEHYQDSRMSVEIKTPLQEECNNANTKSEDPGRLQAGVDALLQQIKVLEARYQHLEEKARAKTALYHESTSRLEEMSTQLFEAQQQLSAQREKLQVYSDQSARTDDLQQEIHLLRSENVKLNEIVAALSSRPFDTLSIDLHKKNLWIAQLEEEKRVLEENNGRLKQDCITTRRAHKQLRHRVEAVSAEVRDLANELSRAKAECEQKAIETEVAQLQLRFYTAPGDYSLMSAFGKALKAIKKQQREEEAEEVADERRCATKPGKKAES